jgi:general secretion pathway protein D
MQMRKHFNRSFCPVRLGNTTAFGAAGRFVLRGLEPGSAPGRRDRAVGSSGRRSGGTVLAAALAALLLCASGQLGIPAAWAAPQAKGASADSSSAISLQLRNVAVVEVLKTLAERGKLNLVVSPGVQGNVTLFLDGVDVMRALEMTVDAANLAYAIEDGTVKVMSEQEYEKRYGKPFRDLNVTKTFHLKYTDALTMSQNLRQFKTASGEIATDMRTNSIMVIDVPDVIKKMADYISQVDLPIETRAYSLKFADAATLANVIRPFLSVQARIQTDKDNNKLIISDIPSRMDAAERVIMEYETQPDTETRVFKLNYVRPDTLARDIMSRLTPGVGSARADVSTSKLFVTDLPERLDWVGEYIAHLDERTPEVVIESKIFQVSLDDRFRMGVDWDGLISKIGGKKIDAIEVRGRFPALADDEPGGVVTAGVGNDNYSALVQALESVGETNLLSSPRITAMNREQASILVGSTVPYVTIDSRQDASGVITRFEKVVEVDVGVKLSVTPEIHRDGYISMNIRPEVSSVTGFNNDIPIVETTQAETRVMVKDGSTIVIAGLIQDEIRETVDKVPVLGSIPILGFPFRSTDKRVVKSELVIFLSPTIVGGDETPQELERLEKKHKVD